MEKVVRSQYKIKTGDTIGAIKYFINDMERKVAILERGMDLFSDESQNPDDNRILLAEVNRIIVETDDLARMLSHQPNLY